MPQSDPDVLRAIRIFFPLEGRAALFDLVRGLLKLEKLVVRRVVVAFRLALSSDVGFYGILWPAVVDREVPPAFCMLDTYNITAIEVELFIGRSVRVLEGLDSPLFVVLADVGLVPGEEGLGVSSA